MEILIGGIILVAIMAYASTRIKRSAAHAFDAESVDTPEFAMEKPDGFLNVINRDPTLLLEGYSKDFGKSSGRDTRLVRIEVRGLEKTSVNKLVRTISDREDLVSDVAEIVDGQKYHVLETTLTDNDIAYRAFYKIGEKGRRVYELRITALDETDADTLNKTDAMLSSFVLK